MAKEKIRCKKCRKSFDPELYSGLCPKCGAYNGRHMDNSALELYISGHDQGETAHRELHEKYDQGYDAAHPKYDDNKRKKVGKSPFAKMIKALLITVIIMVIMTVIMVLYTNIAFMGKTEANIIEVISSVEPGKVIFDHVLLESPIEVSIKSAGIVEEIEDLSGKSIYVVTAGGGSEEYNFDARMHDVFLQYEFEGNIYYEMPMSSYNLEEFCKKYNIWEDEVLSGYEISSSSFEEGYLIFIVDSEGSDFKLLLQLSQYEDPAVILQEAVIDLEELPKPDMIGGEVE